MTKTIKFAGFTLIELLIVIGLLAALAAVMLPSMMGSKEEALAGLDKYNAAGSLRTLRQYEVITGNLPNGLHSGLTDSYALMSNVTAAYRKNAADSIEVLTDEDVEALGSIGITDFAYGIGDSTKVTREDVFGYESLKAGSSVVVVNTNWKDEDGTPITFNGKGIDALNAEGYSKIINVFLAPTADWSAKGTGWVKGFSVGMDIPGTCPIVDEDEFNYYTVFIGIKNGSATITSNVSTDPTSTANVPPVTGLAASTTEMSDAETEVASWITTAGATITDDSWTTVASNVKTKTVTYSSGTVTGTITFRIVYSDANEATLLGTSCPEHGVTNP
jgi:prepilin-type N-terminal cleavage/methylation domain-containing protein